MFDKKHCSGCRNNFYNGNNSFGVRGCWSSKGAKIVKRIPIGFWESPPYLNKKTVSVPNCWHDEGSNRTLYVERSRINSKGFWA